VRPDVHIQIRELPGGAVGMEWDVQACESFSADPGHWKRLRPDEAIPA
jgi:hypothetical protein